MPNVRNSAHWMPDIKVLCRDFYAKCVNKAGATYRENQIAQIDAFCDTTVDAIRNEVYRGHPGTCDCLLDHHKIAAVYILGVLKNPVFIKENAIAGETFVDLLANEHYCLLLLSVILLGWNRSTGELASLYIPRGYKDCLLQLFYRYGKSPLVSMHDKTFVYALSNIVYLVERCFLSK